MKLHIGILSGMVALGAFTLGAEPIEEAFRNPPREAGVWVWWHWQGNNVTRKGVTLDLEAMRDSGIAGATIFTIAEHAGLGVLSNQVNAAMAYRNAEWWDLVAFAVEEAARLGLKIGMHNSPGFSVTGGPWIDPAHAMQRVVWTKRSVPGGGCCKGTLERPRANLGFYRDIAVLAVSEGESVAASDILDLTSRCHDGVLDWRAPAGRNWTVYRFGHTPTGQRTHPVPDEIRKTCLETDKLSREATELHIREGLEPLKARLGRRWGTTFTQVTVDSYEAGTQNWSPRFREDFAELAGYDPVPFLPVLDGRTVGSPDRARAFRADMDDVVRRLFARNYHDVLHGWARKSGVELHLEPYGGPFDPFEAAAASDVPMVEFWNGVPSWLGNRPWLYGGFPGIPGAVGRALGRAIVASEAFTGGPGVSRWTEAPRDFKRSGDAALARGINRLVLHHWVHQPFGDDVRPGMSMGFWGSHFGRTQTWHRPARAFYRYWARCQALLQRGKAVVPVLTVGTRRDLEVRASETDAMPLSLFLREGYVRVDAQGRVALPSGRAYPVLRVPRADGLRPPEAQAVAARASALVRAGATVWGDMAPPTGAKGRVIAANKSHAAALASVGIRPPVEIAARNLDALTAERYILAGVRQDGDARLFFLACGHTNAVSFAATFDAGGRVPEVWNPETGETGEADVWRALPDGRVRVELEMGPSDALFVVFRRAAQGRRVASRPARPFAALREIDGPWRVRFAPSGGAPDGAREWRRLASWSESSTPGIRFYSGTATYETAFDLSEADLEGREFRLDLGRVEVIAEAELNGIPLGTAWRPPYRLPATKAVRAGRNALRVRVTSTWKNRLLGDRLEPADLECGDETSLPDWGWIAKAKPGRGVSRFPDWLLKGTPRPSRGRVAMPLWDYYADGGLPEETLALSPSGLLGPVRLESRPRAAPAAQRSGEPAELRAESRMSSRTNDPKRDPGIFGDYWWANRFLSRHQAIEKVKGREVDVVLLGDSITHFWEWRHPESWARFCAGRTVLNLGYGGDCTQHVVWRIEHGELDGYDAKCVVVMIGTNNNSSENANPANVAAAIEKIVAMVRARQPHAKIVLHPIFPRGASASSPRHAKARARNDRTNELLKAFAERDGRVVWVDFNAKLVDASGWAPKSLMPDEIHPSDAGYDIWKDALAPFLKPQNAKTIQEEKKK